MIKFLAILCFFLNISSYTDCAKYCESRTLGNWTCRIQEDHSLTVTLDCDKNPFSWMQNKETVWIWSYKFPRDMKKLIIQNCKALDVYAEFAITGERDILPSHFQVLHILNVSNLYITRKNLVGEEKDHPTYLLLGHYLCTGSRLPEKIIFENVENVKIESRISGDGCGGYHYKLISIKLLNVSIQSFNEIFQTNYPLKIQEFVMDNVKINNIDYLESTGIKIDNKDAFISVKNSIFGNVNNTYIMFDGNEVIIANNSFKQMYRTKTFILKANKLIFEGNDISVTDSTFDITAADIRISHNIFYHLYKGSVSNIDSTSTIQKNISTFYDFSNNVIYSIDPEAFDFRPNSEPNLFNNTIIYNNSVDCVCKNMHWFHSIAEKDPDFQKQFFKSKWFQPKNNNKCLNIPNCSVSQVLKNYQDLCDEHKVHFDCSGEFVIPTTVNSRAGNNPKENKPETTFDFLINKKDYVEDGSFMNDMNVVKICLVVLTCLFCVKILSTIVMKISKSRTFKIVTGRKYFTKQEIEMNQSSVTELCGSLD